MSIGKKLKDERERQGISLDAVAEATKIRKLYLAALEAEDYQELPQRVYATGFVANYARFLNLDAEQAVRDFKAEAYPSEMETHPELIPSRKKKVRKRIVRPGVKKKLPINNIVAAALFLLIIWWLGTYIAGYMTEQAVKRGTPETGPSTVQEAQLPVSSPAAPVPEATTQPKGLQLLVTAEKNCWLEVSADGVNIYTGTMLAGEKQSFTARERISLRAGNAGGIELNLNGNKLAPLGTEGQVAVKEFTLNDVKSN